MTRDEIIGTVQVALDDLSSTFFDTDSIGDSIQDSYNETSLVSECIETYANIDFVSGQTYYDFSSLLTRYLRILSIFNNNTNRWLEPISLQGLVSIDDKWESTTGEPTHFWPINFQYVALWPIPASASGNMMVSFKQYADTLTGSDTPNIPDENIKILEYLTVSDLFDQIEEFNKSLKFFAIGQESLAQLTKAVNKRVYPDYIARLR